jgi:hypothetical protein
VTTLPATSAEPRKPVQQPLFDASAEPRASREEWRLDPPPPGIGTLPRDVYVAYCVLRQCGPVRAERLRKEIFRVKDWDVLRIERVVKRLACCGHVTTSTDGVMAARP